MKNNSFVKVATVSPKLYLAKPIDNIKIILDEINRLKDENPHFIVFPELCVTGYSAMDLFYQTYLINENKAAIGYLLENNTCSNIIILGALYVYKNNLFNCAYVIQKNKVLGIIPKVYLPNYDEFYERRYFMSGAVLNDQPVYISEYDTYFGTMIFHEESKDINFGVEICEDMWAPIPPSAYMSINGAELLFNLSASNEVLDKDLVRRYTTQSISRRNNAAYVYVSCGRFESTQDTVFSNHSLIVQNGVITKESDLFSSNDSVLIDEIDLGYLKFLRRKNSTLKDSLAFYKRDIKVVELNNAYNDESYEPMRVNKMPFVPSKTPEASFHKIKEILVAALAKRIQYVNAQSVVLGLSGGLDSTLAYLTLYKTYEFLNKSFTIKIVTLPGFGTSERTLTNALNLGKALGIEVQSINIENEVIEMFKAIQHDQTVTDVTYENAQARTRTAILMNLANKHHGLVLGTGDLSELALGWCTFNGDQMSNYSINAGIPKTLVKFLVKAFADYEFKDNELLRTTLYDILDTPISPELSGQSQKTEDLIGKYEVNDFIIYRMLVCGDEELRIRYLLEHYFTELSMEEINHYVNNFYQRFFSQQFKRSALPDGPKVLDISLSPRSDWRMPSDAHY